MTAKSNRQLEVIYVRVADLEPYARNARMHPPSQVAQIAASIKRFGFTNPILIDEHGGIIAGHGRALAAAQLGMDTVPTIKLHNLSDAEKRAYVIADNKLAINAVWDPETLMAELEALSTDGIGADLMGFSDDDMARLNDELAAISLSMEQKDASDVDDHADDNGVAYEQNDDDAQGASADDTASREHDHAGETAPAEYVTFACAMTEEARASVVEALALAKRIDGVRTTPDALVLIATRYINANS